MKQYFFELFVCSLILTSCLKKSTADSCTYTIPNTVAPSAEVSSLQSWINANASTATQHSSGIFYIITNPGTGSIPVGCSNITVKYTGALLSGSIFDQNTTTGISTQLGRLIMGWQKGLPLIKAGGSITLFIPPSLGYGSQEQRNNNGIVTIPSNSNLKFTIELVSVQ